MNRTHCGIAFTLFTLALSWRSSDPQAEAPVATVVPDGRVGTVVDRQGTALVRPVGKDRWSLLRQRALVMPGDQVRTPVAGANAVEIDLSTGGKLVVGPGALVELSEVGKVRLYRGDLAVVPGKAAVVVRGPGGFEQSIAKPTDLRAADGKTVALGAAPRWLTGYRSSTTDEWVGALLAKVDGRDVPLTVGYHKVDVVIRDQIAQTTVEQSFRNTTGARLEGVFTFPLPADASISGFGMWIGNELVEADIVEKERARQIYEDILRRKKDPGLLEWSGGNLFKARVFPIEPHSEKRIRLRYTQVLPLAGDTLRYRYALRSELLRKNPLRKLDIKVSVASARKLHGVTSPTHEVRVRNTDHAATLEYDAEQVTPERDFEAKITVDRSTPLTVVPHRRGDDGYFLMWLTPPGAGAGGWQRDLVPDGEPVEVLVVADTSASMDSAARQRQAEFLRALLGMLGPKDRFQLCTADVEVAKHTAAPVAVTEESIGGALSFLAERASLGWTDLDRVLTRIAADARPGTVVVYVGDGIGTTGDADPVALAARVRAAAGRVRGVVHAVPTASTYERGVLEALAGLGGGAIHDAAVDPTEAAFHLLAEAARPAIKNLQVRFDGVRTARVYPGTLANLPTGSQHAVLGRYLPTGADQSGSVVVTGTLDGKPVRYTTAVQLADAEHGNSFVPRLWARRHVDALLAEGRSPSVKADIVAFSEEFGIMTPYTSFLVLENDEDRKRYGVERRVHMRDGERFFTAGRDAASTEILRQQMRAAKTYRLQLKLRMLAEIERLGRDLSGWSVAVSNPVSRPVDSLRAGWDGELGLSVAKNHGPGAGPVTGALPSEEDQGDLDKLAFEPPTAQPALQDYDVDYRDLPAATKAMLPSVEKRVDRSSDGYFRMGGASGPRTLAPPRQPPGPVSFAFYGFPELPAPHVPATQPTLARWSEAVRELVATLDRRARLRNSKQAFHLVQTVMTVHRAQGRITHWRRAEGRYCAGEWTLRHTGRQTQPMLQYVYAGRRGVVAEAVHLGRVRDADAHDARFAFPLHDYSQVDLQRSFAGYSAALTPAGTAVVKLVLTAPAPATARLELTIDRERRVVLSATEVRNGKTAWTTVFTDFVARGGEFFARRSERRDSRGRVIRRETLEVEVADPQSCRTAMQRQIAAQGDVAMLGQKDPELAAAKKSLAAGGGGLAEHLRLATHYQSTQRWTEAWASFDRAAAVMGDKPAVPMMRLRLLTVSRRGPAMLEHARRIVTGWNAALRGGKTPAGIDFLVELLRTSVFQQVSSAEQLALLDSLAPLYRRPLPDAAPEYLAADRDHRDLALRRFRASALESLQRLAPALQLRAETAARHPLDFAAVQDYVSALGRYADYAGQIGVVRSKLAQPQSWLRSELRFWFQVWHDALYSLRDLDGLVQVGSEWLTKDPESSEGYDRWLSSQMFKRRESEVVGWIRKALDNADPRDPVGRARLQAAVHHALGRGWQLNDNAIDAQWQQPLARVVRRCAQSDAPEALQIAGEVFGSWQFRRTDAWKEIQSALRGDFLGAAATMSLRRLGAYLTWLSWHRNSVDRSAWQQARDALRARFDGAADPSAQQVLGGHLLALLDAWPEKTQALAFLRHWLAVAKTAPESVAAKLFQRQLTGDWTAALEDEVFALVPRLQPERAEPIRRGEIAAAAARQLADRLLAIRVRAALGPVEQLEKLPRTERRDRTERARKAARQALAARFGAAAAAASKLHRPWFVLEQLGFDAEAGGDRSITVQRAAELLDAVPGRGDDEPSLNRILRARSAVTMAYAATRRDTAATVGDTVLAHLQRHLAADPKALDWRREIFRLLVALDRTDELTALLQKWIDAGEAQSEWRVALGYLMAERGKVAQAAAVFERVEKVDELSAEDYRTLATWYLVLGDDAHRATAQERSFEVSAEYQLGRRLQRLRGRLNRPGAGLSGAVATEDLAALRVLLRKASYPANYVWQVRSAYQSSKEFRILGTLPYGVIGHTTGRAYEFLARVGQVISQVHEEATCDSLIEAIAKLRATAARGVDRRGLLLLTSQVEARAAEVRNASGPHLDRALEALRGAAQGQWEPGERAAMADYLQSLGRMRHQSLGEEQLRQLSQLFAQVEPDDRLQVARALAQTQWRYEYRDQAIDTLIAALDDCRTRHDGVLPATSHAVFDTVLKYLRERRQFARGEALLTSELARQTLLPQRLWFVGRLDSHYIECLRKRGEVSLGSGVRLYRALLARLSDRLWREPWIVLQAKFDGLCRLHDVAHEVGITAARRDLRAFADRQVPELAERFLLDRGAKLSRLATTLDKVLGGRVALEFLVRELETEPTWLRSVHREQWRAFHYQVAKFAHAGAGSLTGRLRPLVLGELRRDLERMNWRGSEMFFKNNRWFWHGGAGDFAEVARSVIAAHPKSEARVTYVARYLWNGLGEREAAITALRDLDRSGALLEGGRWQLANWLIESRQHAEAIPYLVALIGARRDRLDYRIALVRARQRTGDRKGAEELLLATAKRWEDKHWWHEHTIAELAKIAFDCGFFDHAASWYEAALRTNERLGGRRWNWRHTRTSYYGFLARSLAKLGKVDESIDAAAAAVVTWGDNQRQRNEAIASLRAALREIGDLDAYVARWDAKVARTGLDAPLIRKSVGILYLDRGATRQAIAQLRKARELQPADDEVHTRLLQAFDRAGDRSGAIEALFASLKVAPRNLDLYAELARRLEAQGDPTGAERALTSMVEVEPNEAEGHRRLAKVRAEQKRDAAAVVQWRQVVRVRSLEPDGWLSLASAQIDAGQLDEAAKTLQHVLSTKWEARFQDVHRKARALQDRLRRAG
ncbi:MAG: hypothetical protein H6837_10900 [Planctomycetes bacterium]|nr:hypothetical protein [Planctomycetota bacterium]